MPQRLCKGCKSIMEGRLMSFDGYDWWCKPCMDAAYDAFGVDLPERNY